MTKMTKLHNDHDWKAFRKPNAILKIVWAQKVVWYAHNNDILNNGQTRSWSGTNAVDVVV
jgi:hypothetical protein